MLDGKNGIIFGVANKRSIAWAIAQSCSDARARLAFNYLDDGPASARAAQQVMQALSVFPAPVSAVGVDFLLQPVNPTTDAAPNLTRLNNWGQPVASADDAGTSRSFDFSATKARSVLVWFTKLPTGANGSQYVQVSEVTVG